VREFENMLGCHLHEWRRLTCENDFMSLHEPPTRPIPRRAAMKIAIVATSLLLATASPAAASSRR
jgi:hypothetical protein